MLYDLLAFLVLAALCGALWVNWRAERASARLDARLERAERADALADELYL